MDQQPKSSLGQKIVLVVGGLVLSLVLLEGALRLGGFVLSQLQEHRNRLSLEHKGVRILCLGESTTDRQYPPFLEKYLNQAGSGTTFRVIDKGIVGTNTLAILQHLEANLDRYDPQIVVTMMGANDMGPHMPADFRDLRDAGNGWKSLRVYRLFELLALHLATKMIDREPPLMKYESVSAAQAFLDDNVRGLEVPDLDSQPFDKERILRVAESLRLHREHTKAIRYFIAVVKRFPRDPYALNLLGWAYVGAPGRALPAVIYFNRALKLKPDEIWSLKGLGLAYNTIHHFESALPVWQKVIRMAPNEEEPYIRLANCYFAHNQYKDAEPFIREGLRHCPGCGKLYGALALIALMTRGQGEPGSYAVLPGFPAQTIQNYQTLSRLLRRRNICHVCVQYPMRSIQPLQSMFVKDDNIIFVDNEKTFKSVVKKEGFWAYFIDSFGGDFGHCTEKGNRLLAENITNVILKEVIGK